MYYNFMIFHAWYLISHWFFIFAIEDDNRFLICQFPVCPTWRALEERRVVFLPVQTLEIVRYHLTFPIKITFNRISRTQSSSKEQSLGVSILAGTSINLSDKPIQLRFQGRPFDVIATCRLLGRFGFRVNYWVSPWMVLCGECITVA